MKTVLLGSLTGAYMLIVFTLTVAVAMLPFGTARQLLAPPGWALPVIGHAFVLDVLLTIVLGPTAGVALIALLIVVLSTPGVYRWLRSGVNSLIDAEHDDPFALIARLDPHLRAMDVTHAILPAIVTTIAQTLKLPYVAIAAPVSGVTGPSAPPLAAAYGQPAPKAEPVRLPLIYQDSPIGELIVTPRRHDEPLSRSDMRVLHDLARQVGIALYAAQLTGELQRSRMRLVTAREEERRRIRRDLHDGLGPTLASFAMQLEHAREHLPPSAETSDAILARLTEQAKATIADIRRLVYDLRPPDLDEYGLVAALREYLYRVQPRGAAIDLNAPADLPCLPAATEVAIYRIVQEAVNNCVRHARALHIAVALIVEQQPDREAILAVSVQDDGVGLPDDHRSGIGLRSMRERAEELGGSCTVHRGGAGGTQVLVYLPLTAEAE